VDLTAILSDYNEAEEKKFECRSPVHPVMLLCCHNTYIAFVCLLSCYVVLLFT